MATPIEEARWVLVAQCGDRDALELLLRSVQPSLRRYVAGLVGDADADDVLQDSRRPETDVAELAPEPVEFALKRVDRSRQIVVITIVALLVAMLFSLLHLMSTAVRNPTAGLSKMLYVSVAAQMLFTAVCAGLLAFHVTRMTKSVLHAIDLARVVNRNRVSATRLPRRPPSGRVVRRGVGRSTVARRRGRRSIGAHDSDLRCLRLQE